MINKHIQDVSVPGVAWQKFAVGMVIAALSLSAHATLGGDAHSVIVDQAALHAAISADVVGDYTDYRLALTDGGVVHEFVNASGRVFEVTWSEMGRRPDMGQLLGSYMTHFARTSGKPRPVDRHADRVEAGLEIHSAVRNRYFTGSAHLPTALPESLHHPISVPAEAQ